ncbi:hypothetical protein E4U30_003174 [Claviceps sp. LM220 group G6]|nr:hypothetical protein E4U15_006222 [Claviceps sp. LM218 group G6]KAG6094663.1 hypothetical protein E4U30_003174 [Claviceps sp. LM220 group G6]KAG6106852.1 hypothetical protein E4U31_000550 [Claviceps sp. LM219 group G6]
MAPASKTRRKGCVTGNASIVNFFKPIARAPLGPSTPPPENPQEPPAVSSPISILSISPSPPPPTSPPRDLPSTPTRPPRTEICASDDENSGGSDSETSLEDLSRILGHVRNVASVPQKSSHIGFTTPKAKRTALQFHASPLAILPKHKFDLKALAKDAQYDDATKESYRRIQQALSVDLDKKNNTPPGPSATETTIAGIVREKGGQEQDARKVLRAVQRYEGPQSQDWYLFFEQAYRPDPLPKAPSLPHDSPWGLLTQGRAASREQHLVSGVPQTLLRKMGGLPDSLFEWMLESLCLEQHSVVTRQEYCNMIASCPTQIDRLLTVERIRQLFILLGARDLDRSKSELRVVNLDHSHELYEDRDWSCLRSFISLLGLVADQLPVESAMFAAQTLVQLALDKVLLYNIDILHAFEHTLQKLTAAIPSSLSWDTFCFETSVLLRGIKSRNIIATTLLCIPISSHRTHNLRRRIAVSALFQNDALAKHDPEDIITLRSIIDLLDEEAFAIKPSTDFSELRANIILLDMAVDDGSVIPFNDRAEENRFNDEVDELAGRLREIWRKTNDAGMKLTRTEAKSVVELVQQRLLHSVRTRKKAKKSIFDYQKKEDPFLPQQREYMQKFVQKKA